MPYWPQTISSGISMETSVRIFLLTKKRKAVEETWRYPYKKNYTIAQSITRQGSKTVCKKWKSDGFQGRLWCLSKERYHISKHAVCSHPFSERCCIAQVLSNQDDVCCGTKHEVYSNSPWGKKPINRWNGVSISFLWPFCVLIISKEFRNIPAEANANENWSLEGRKFIS